MAIFIPEAAEAAAEAAALAEEAGPTIATVGRAVGTGVVAAAEEATPAVELIGRAVSTGAGQGALWAGRLVAAAVLILALLISYALSLLLRALAAIFGVVPGIGGWIRDHIVSAGLSAIGAVTGWVAGSLGSMIGMIWAPIRWLGAMIGVILEGIYEAGEMGIRIVTVTIPGFVGKAFDFAVQVFHQAVHYVDVTAGKLADFATQLYHQTLSAIDAAAGRLAHFATDLYNQAIHYVDVTAGKLADFATQLYHQAEHDIGVAAQGAVATAHKLDDAVRTDLGRDLQQRVKPLEDLLRHCDKDLCQITDCSKELQTKKAILEIDPLPLGWVTAAIANPVEEGRLAADAFSAILEALRGDLPG